MHQFLIAITLISLTSNFYQLNASCIAPNITDATVRSTLTGQLVAPGYRVSTGDMIEVHCNSGYRATRGSNIAICMSNRLWYHTELPKRFVKCHEDTFNSRCGTSSNTVFYGGDFVGPGEFPWMGRLEIMQVGSPVRKVCAGSLINREWVLTAAHCLTEGGHITSINIHFGRINFWAYSGQTEQVRSSQFYVIHPAFGQGGALNNDFALIKLNYPVTFTQNVRKICLPRRRMCRGWSTVPSRTITVDSCSSAVVAGWGQTRMNQTDATLILTLKKLNISMLANEQCVNAGLSSNLSSTQLCAGVSGQTGKIENRCEGDSGGPMMCMKNRRFVAVGVVSFGSLGCGTGREPNIYSRICGALSWITNTTSETGLEVIMNKPATIAKPECLVGNELLRYVCSDKGINGIPPRFAMWPLTDDYGATEIMKGFNGQYQSEFVLLTTGPTGKYGTAHLLGYDLESYIKVKRNSLINRWGRKSFSITFFAVNLHSLGVPLIEFYDKTLKFHIWFWYTADQLFVNTRCNNNNANPAISDIPCPRGQWNYIAVTVSKSGSSTNVTAYCNDKATSINYCADLTGDLYIGRRVSGHVLKGKMSCLTFHDNALTSEEIGKEKELCKFHFYDRCTCPS